MSAPGKIKLIIDVDPPNAPGTFGAEDRELMADVSPLNGCDDWQIIPGMGLTVLVIQLKVEQQ
jgi:hypothetical protein